MGRQSYATHDGYCFAGFFAKATNLGADDSVGFEILDGSTVRMASGTVSQSAPTVLHWFDEPPSRASITVKLKTDWPAAPASLTVTIAELLRYKPSLEDSYLAWIARGRWGGAAAAGAAASVTAR